MNFWRLAFYGSFHEKSLTCVTRESSTPIDTGEFENKLEFQAYQNSNDLELVEARLGDLLDFVLSERRMLQPNLLTLPGELNED
jgi:hypothetical protein